MRALISILSISTLFALAACDSADGVGGSVGYDIVLSEVGATVGSGRLTFASAPTPGAGVSGDYNLTATGGGPFDPLPTTSGSFSGNFEGDSLIVTIVTPGTSDVGLRLAGLVTGTAYSGNWSEITIAGPQLRGTFVGNAN